MSSGGTAASLSVMRSYEPNRNLITGITNSFNGVPLHRFDYVNDAIGRRVQRADVDISTVISNLFAYNARSELEDAAMGTNSYSYRYDPIGNRRMSAISNQTSVITTYAANSLNQYSQITNHQSPITPAYDADGNMTAYKGWTFTWDAENRLVMASNATTVLTFGYDYMSRRVSKVVNGQATQFKYQGWAMIEEVSSSSTNHYVYGLDLSGSQQGAGTIGGILSLTTQQPDNSTTAYYAYDANGNVTDLIGTNGAFLAQYQYDPYGNLISEISNPAISNPFKFSAKYLDAETGFYYYGHRFYSPEMWRWTARDPALENGGINIYESFIDSPVIIVDTDGNKPVLSDGKVPPGNAPKPTYPNPNYGGPTPPGAPKAPQPNPQIPTTPASDLPQGVAGGIPMCISWINSELNMKELQKGLAQCGAQAKQNKNGCKCCVLQFAVKYLGDIGNDTPEVLVVLKSAYVENNKCTPTDFIGCPSAKSDAFIPVYLPW